MATHLTRQDLRGFDGASKDLILWAQEQGGRVRISKRGHALVYAANGQSTSVPRKLTLGNRTAQNARAGIARLFRDR